MKKIRLALFSLVLGCIGYLAHAEQITTTSHTVQVALEPLSITCKFDDFHKVYKIALSLFEATITPPIQDSLLGTLYSTNSGGATSYNQCVSQVQDIHRRYPQGSSFVIRRTIKKSWERGCQNDRCPKIERDEESLSGEFDGHLFSSDLWESSEEK